MSVTRRKPRQKQRPEDDPQQSLEFFCRAVALNVAPPEDVMRWLADCLRKIADDRNHRARPAFGLTARGRPRTHDNGLRSWFFVALARKYGHTLDSALEHAAEELGLDRGTIDKQVRGMTKPVLGSLASEFLEQVLAEQDWPLPRRPQSARKKGARPATKERPPVHAKK